MKRLSAIFGLLLCGALLGVFATFLFVAGRGARPEAWHQLHPRGELTARLAADVPDLDAYRQLEERLFTEASADLAERVERFPVFSRFDPTSSTYPGRFERDWNRTFELVPAGPVRGEALLLHGLSDSPYSLRAVGRFLEAHGFHVVGLRLPGHGVVPGGLSVAKRDDWRAAVRLGVGATGEPARAAGVPFLVVGYSNGAALALDYTLEAIEVGAEPVPDRLVFLSPAFAVAPIAGLARWQLRLSRLPGLERLAWNSLEEEFDPFKFNSFPIRAGAEIHDLTVEIEERLARLEEGGVRSLPPVLALQSVVDATVPPVTSLTRLFSRVRSTEEESELVLFDANRRAGIGDLLGPEADELLALGGPDRRFDFRITLVTNAETGSARVEARTRAAGSSTVTRVPLGLDWPQGVYSLSHVAIPFPPDDPAYGVADSPVGPPFPFGRLALKGERGVLRIPDRLLTRLRYNPFFPVVQVEMGEFLGLTEVASPPDPQ